MKESPEGEEESEGCDSDKYKYIIVDVLISDSIVIAVRLNSQDIDVANAIPILLAYAMK